MTEHNLNDTDGASSVRAPDDGDERPKQKKRDKRDVHGWVVLDKPVGMTSTHAVSVVKRLFSAKRCGHAGTLDPLASGALPIALGEATKTVPFVMDGRKLYRFAIQWGEERDTDDAEGRAVSVSNERPSPEAIRTLLPSYTGLHTASAAALFGNQDRRRAGVRSGPGWRAGGTRISTSRNRSLGAR